MVLIFVSKHRLWVLDRSATINVLSITTCINNTFFFSNQIFIFLQLKKIRILHGQFFIPIRKTEPSVLSQRLSLYIFALF